MKTSPPLKLIVHRGCHEIGGNCIELATPTTRLILDVGMPLMESDGRRFDATRLNGRSRSELLSEGVLPKVSGLFDEEPPPEAILLSHAHQDHTGLLHYSCPGIPVYASTGTSKMMMAGAIFAGQKQLERQRFREIKSGVSFEVGDFRITPYNVDHSAFDSMAFVIDAGGKRVVYSGDLRMHGRKPGMMRRFVEALASQPVDVLLMEGTNVGQPNKPCLTEHALEEQIIGHIKTAPSLVLAAFSPMNIDRLVTFYRAARRSGRIFVVDVYTAFVMHLVAGQCRIPRPIRPAGIRVYYNASFEATCHRRRLGKIHRMFAANRIGLNEILSAPGQHVMVFRPSMLQHDFRDVLPVGSRCLYSHWAGYLDKPEWRHIQERLARFDGDSVPVHTSGHLFSVDIKELVHKIRCHTVVPIHTFGPHLFGDSHPSIYTPPYGLVHLGYPMLDVDVRGGDHNAAEPLCFRATIPMCNGELLSQRPPCLDGKDIAAIVYLISRMATDPLPSDIMNLC